MSAIFMGKDYELAVYSKDDFIWDKADLLVAPADGATAPGSGLQAFGAPGLTRPAGRREPDSETRSPKPEVRSSMIIGAVADIHGNFDALTRAMARHPEVPLWMCVGDLGQPQRRVPGDARRRCTGSRATTRTSTGSREWEAGRPGAAAPSLHPERHGRAGGPLTVAGLGGTFAPTWFDTPAGALPHTPKDDKRRHFVREEAEACKRLEGVDILMTHEAARPFILVDERGGRREPRRRDAGKPAINEVLAALQPRLHLCGHHHRFTETVRGRRAVGLHRSRQPVVSADRRRDAGIREDRAVR